MVDLVEEVVARDLIAAVDGEDCSSCFALAGEAVAMLRIEVDR